MSESKDLGIDCVVMLYLLSENGNLWLIKGALCALSCVQLFQILWTVARQAPLSMDFPGKNTRVGWYFLLLGISPTQGSNLRLLHWQTGSLLLRWILFDNSSFYRWGNWGTENLNKFPKIQRTQEKPQQICARPVCSEPQHFCLPCRSNKKLGKSNYPSSRLSVIQC